MPRGNWRTRLFTVSMSTCLERAPLMGQAIRAGALPGFAFTEQQSDIRISSSRPYTYSAVFLFGGLIQLRWIARIRRSFHESIRVGSCIVEGHQNLLLFKPHVHSLTPGNFF